MTESDSVPSVHIDDIDYTDDLFVTYQGEFFTGRVTDYYRDGRPRKVETYENGRLRGLERTFYPDGSVMSEYWNVDDGRHGVGRSWFSNGQLESETQYDRGKVLRRKRWAEDGTELS
ncbi:MORN repeat protein [Frankia sp. EI5c]|uniref:toxin-antitoxin system YwqK family antitoxin n=1 Tax=Frankia sp. EI5c TaxID=683316 RepID=UPI0007C25073|nr:hypothetical protein [Frankia sp. EI5c]OAA27480.1 MORN repeat protein [Frankia sp. EI5c]